jgi:hypothetical protein
VAETKAFVHVLRLNGLAELADQFLGKAFDSKKWVKWMLPATTVNDEVRALIAGHYVFSDPEVLCIQEKANGLLKRKGIDLDAVLANAVKEAILRYMRAFRLTSK